jgi:hypothetical protein
MAKKLRIRDFLGLVTNSDQLDRKPGALQRSKNIVYVKRGEAKVRAGTRQVQWSN